MVSSSHAWGEILSNLYVFSRFSFIIRSFIFAIHMLFKLAVWYEFSLCFNSIFFSFLQIFLFFYFFLNFGISVFHLQHVWRKQNKFWGSPSIVFRMHRNKDLKFCKVIFLGHHQSWFDFGHALFYLIYFFYFYFLNSSTAFILFESGYILHVGIYSPPSEFIILCPCSIDFHNSSTIFHQHTKLRSVLAA